MALRGITLREWNQFEAIDIEFSPRCTILTGANGAGKSTILRLLAKHAGWEFYDLRIEPTVEPTPTEVVPPGHRWIGEIRYAGAPPAVLSQEQWRSRKETRIQVSRLRHTPCLYIPAVRPSPPYRRAELPPVSPFSPRDGLRDVDRALKALNEGASDQNPAALVASYLRQLLATADHPILRKFSTVVDSLLPPELGFQRFAITNDAIVVVSDRGDFHFSAASGGISNLLILAWLCTMFNAAEGGGTILLDEPENHLHPALQRIVLPTLVEQFPQVQFIVATHSPLVVGAIREASEYALPFASGGVRSVDLSPLVAAGTASDFLHDVLGVSFAGPLWVERRLEDNYAWLRDRPLTDANLREFENRMARDGLDRFIPRAILRAVRGRDE